MKKLLYIVVSIMIVVGLLPLGAFAAGDEGEPPQALLGDVDLNGVVAPADARLALRASVGLEPEILPGTDVFIAADADFDGKITSADARSILRAAVDIEDLADRLPESEALTEEELTDRINASMLSIDVDYDESHGEYGVGFAFGENGTVVVPYHLIRRAIGITVSSSQYPDCRVESVLAVDPVADIALLKVSGDIPSLPVNRTWFEEGNTVYSTDYLGLLHKLTLVAPPSAAGSDASVPSVYGRVRQSDHSFDLLAYPMVDRFGRAIGIILEDGELNGRRIARAVPLSLLPAPDAYHSRSVEEFSRDEWRVTPVCPVEAVTLVQYGTGLIPIYMPNRRNETVDAATSRTDLIDVSVHVDSSDPEYPVLVIAAKEPCENIPVTVCVEGRYETAEITLTASVTQDGYVNMAGAEYLPDPGVIWETLPTGVCAGDWIELTFDKSDTGLSEEDLFYSYTDYLIALGYAYVETEALEDVNRYRFRMEEYGITVIYDDKDAAVTVLCGFDE